MNPYHGYTIQSKYSLIHQNFVDFIIVYHMYESEPIMAAYKQF